MRYLAIDPGQRRTGLAVGDDRSNIVSPLAVIDARQEHVRLDAIAKAIAEHEPDALVLGLPVNMDGSEGPAARQSRSLADTLHKRFNLPVHLLDERLTSYAADDRMRDLELTRKGKKQRRDAVAAALILRDFLEARGQESEDRSQESEVRDPKSEIRTDRSGRDE